MRTALEGRGDGREGDEEVGAEVGFQTVDEPDDAAQRHLLLDVEIQSVEPMPPYEIAQGGVVGFEVAVGRVEPAEAALCGAAQHREDFDPDVLHRGDFFP